MNSNFVFTLLLREAGLPLFENINDRTILKLIKTKTFSGGAVTLYYEPTNEKTTNR